MHPCQQIVFQLTPSGKIATTFGLFSSVFISKKMFLLRLVFTLKNKLDYNLLFKKSLSLYARDKNALEMFITILVTLTVNKAYLLKKKLVSLVSSM